MATLLIRTKTPTAQTPTRPTFIERLARRFYTSRMNAAIREIERRPFDRNGWQ